MNQDVADGYYTPKQFLHLPGFIVNWRKWFKTSNKLNSLQYKIEKSYAIKADLIMMQLLFLLFLPSKPHCSDYKLLYYFIV